MSSGAGGGAAADPLIRQQVEWQVRQGAGCRRRAFLVANRSYLGRRWPALSANPTNDLKDMESLLRRGGYATHNIYENVSSAANFEEILSSFVEAVNKEDETIDIIVFYFSGYGVVGEPDRLAAKKSFNIFTDRPGLIYDAALVQCNESLVPVAGLQVAVMISTHLTISTLTAGGRVPARAPCPQEAAAAGRPRVRGAARARPRLARAAAGAEAGAAAVLALRHLGLRGHVRLHLPRLHSLLRILGRQVLGPGTDNIFKRFQLLISTIV